MRLVMKFGGTSVGDGPRIRNVAKLVKRYYDEGNEVIAVASAMTGITDKLYEMAQTAKDTCNIADIEKSFSEVASRHAAAIDGAIDDPEIKKEVSLIIEQRLSELKNALVAVCYLGELTNRSLAYIYSFGERMSVPILSASLRSMGVESVALAGGEAGVITDSKFESAKPDPITDVRVKEKLMPLLKKGTLPVVTGFVAANPSGTITVLGRGGSDYSASIIGAAIDADEIWIYTDVNGIMTTDPRIVPEARTLSCVTYLEAMEMSYFGAKVLHPKTIEPAVKKGIPVRVLNTFQPDHPGTVVLMKDASGNGNLIKAVTMIKNIALINISGAALSGTPGTAGRIFSALGKEDINIIMISQASSEFNVSLAVDGAQADRAIAALRKEFSEDLAHNVTCNNNVCVIAVVGERMAGSPGVAGRLFTALGGSNINIRMISQGSSEANISFVVNKDDAQKAVKVLHDVFDLNKL
ncbi:aspartate kinase [Methanocella paludicola SANAE]|uniref:Aspartokinase n=1 Tax=Methanocella paludicola (strain DSM 17711 / JCM 13418 / NBRC 101707 / SANAE) TaxID=304371 RepID=D1Z1L3_METPS|nr:aspartate kinase [Methanocella paludicola]BAI62585.1 aspartate kinase [Methanocella paludicola SANAE]